MSNKAHLRIRNIALAIESANNSDFLAVAKSTNDSHEQAELDYYMLVEACGVVIAKELELDIAPFFELEKDGDFVEFPTDQGDFAAALDIAERLRYGGKNQLFKQLVVFSSFHDSLCKYADDNPDDPAFEGLRGATFDFTIFL